MQDPIADFQRWYIVRPPLTRVFMTCSFALAVLITLGLVTPTQHLYYDVSLFIQIWRPFTALIYLSNLSMTLIPPAYFTYLSLLLCETKVFQQNQLADFIWLILYLLVGFVGVSSIVNLYFFSSGFTFALYYIYCKRKYFGTVDLVGGLQLGTTYFPWFYLGINVLFGASLIQMFVGLALAGLYIYLKDTVLPNKKIDILATPMFLKKICIGRRRERKEEDEDEEQERRDRQD